MSLLKGRPFEGKCRHSSFRTLTITHVVVVMSSEEGLVDGHELDGSVCHPIDSFVIFGIF